MALTAQQQARKEYLEQLVAIRVDEFIEEASPVDQPDVPTGDIEDELKSATRYVLRKMRRQFTFPATQAGANLTVIEKADEEAAVIPLPDDYLRFTAFRMDGWQRPVNEWISDEDPLFRQQNYPRRRGSTARPVVGMIPFPFEYDKNQSEKNAATALLPHPASGKTDTKASAYLTFDVSDWQYADGAQIDIVLDSAAYIVKPPSTAGVGTTQPDDYTAEDAATLIYEQLNGSYAGDATGYDSLDSNNWNIELNGTEITISRATGGDNPFTWSYSVTNGVNAPGGSSDGVSLSEIELYGGNDGIAVGHKLYGHVDDGNGGTVLEEVGVITALNPPEDAAAGATFDDTWEVVFDLKDHSVHMAAGGEIQGPNDVYRLEIDTVQYWTTTEQKSALKVWPLVDGIIDQFVYVPMPDYWDLPEDLDDPVTWKAAANLFIAMRLPNLAQSAMQQMALSHAGLNTGMKQED